MDAKQLDELKLTGHLPSPTGVGLAILELTRGEDYAMGEVTRVIQGDPALTGRILKISNSAGFAGSQPATTVAQAAMRLGVRSVRNVALGFTLISGNRTGSCRGFDYEHYWAHSLAVAVMAQGLAERLRSVPSADAFTCGLLSGIGSLALASIHPERYEQLVERARRERVADRLMLEREIFDLDHCELSAAMLRDWRLPESFAFAVEVIEQREPIVNAPDAASANMAALLRAARVLASLSLDGEQDERGQAQIDEVLSALAIPAEDFARLRQKCREDWVEWGKALQIAVGKQVEAQAVAAEAARALAVPTDAEALAMQAERKGLRVLVVDDDPVSLRLIAHHLTHDGHHVIKAVNGRQALIAALESNPQMVVTDWMMPEMDGLELCKSLRRANEVRGIYILLLTGREDEQRVVEAFDNGVDEYVVKPFNPKILLARVRAGQRMIELREQVERDRQIRDRQLAELAVLNRKLETAAMTDVLTRLPNRRFALRQLEDELSVALTAQAPLSVVMIDIDHFKLVNDQHGHDMGDLVLRETAAVLRRGLRKGDYVCRLGGEEFLAICPGSTLAQATMTAERLRSAVAEHLIGFGYEHCVTISAGVASLEQGYDTVDELLKLADRRVYAAKASGRNCVCSSDAATGQSKSA